MHTVSWLRRAAICLALAAATQVAAADRPHIVYITVDDLGWKDVGYHGGRIPPPHSTAWRAKACARAILRSALLHADARRGGERPLPDALRPADLADPALQPVRAARRRTHAGAGAEGGGLPHCAGGQVASRPRQEGVLADPARLRHLLWHLAASSTRSRSSIAAASPTGTGREAGEGRRLRASAIGQGGRRAYRTAGPATPLFLHLAFAARRRHGRRPASCSSAFATSRTRTCGPITR